MWYIFKSMFWRFKFSPKLKKGFMYFLLLALSNISDHFYGVQIMELFTCSEGVRDRQGLSGKTIKLRKQYQLFLITILPRLAQKSHEILYSICPKVLQGDSTPSNGLSTQPGNTCCPGRVALSSQPEMCLQLESRRLQSLVLPVRIHSMLP